MLRRLPHAALCRSPATAFFGFSVRIIKIVHPFIGGKDQASYPRRLLQGMRQLIGRKLLMCIGMIVLLVGANGPVCPGGGGVGQCVPGKGGAQVTLVTRARYSQRRSLLRFACSGWLSGLGILRCCFRVNRGLRHLGHRSHQALGVVMPGIEKDLFGGSRFDNLPLVKNRDAIADAGHRGQVVRDVEDGHPKTAVQFTEEGENFRLRDYVEGAGGFIGNQKGGAMQ